MVSTDLIYIVYVSAATRSFSDDDLAALLASFRQNNVHMGITGMLLYCDGQFIQVLEGPRAIVERLYDRIEQDPRHSTVLKLLEQPIKERCFPEWSMGFHTFSASELVQVEGYHSFKESLNTKGQVSASQARVIFSLLDTFKRTMSPEY